MRGYSSSSCLAYYKPWTTCTRNAELYTQVSRVVCLLCRPLNYLRLWLTKLADIKDDNIMVSIEKDKVLEEFVATCSEQPHPKHVRSVDGREVYLSRDDFGPLQGVRLLPALGDFNLCYPGLEDGHQHVSPIQSHRYRAPEVLLGCPWSYSVDIWNLGLLVST
jgi:hypothetical protein